MGKSHKDIEAKKAALEHKLRTLEGKLDRSLDDVKHGVSESLSVRKMITKYPLPAVGVAIVAGLVLGRPKSAKKVHGVHEGRRSSDDVFSVVGQTLKKRITQKAIDTVMDLVEEQLSRQRRGSDPN